MMGSGVRVPASASGPQHAAFFGASGASPGTPARDEGCAPQAADRDHDGERDLPGGPRRRSARKADDRGMDDPTRPGTSPVLIVVRVAELVAEEVAGQRDR